MDSLQLAVSLKRYGFEEVEHKTHALGYANPAMGGQRIYLKVSRSERGEKPKAVAKQPLVLHPTALERPGFDASRVASLGPNFRYKNTNMSTFLHRPGESATGIAVDVPDVGALLELLAIMGVPVASTPSVGHPAEPSSEASSVVAPLITREAKPVVRPRSTHAPKPPSGFNACRDIDFAAHCCQGRGGLRAGPFELDQLTIATEGRRRLRFAPLGNSPAAPRLALVGITPGGQIERFAAALATLDVPAAASAAAFNGAQGVIKELLAAHGFARRIGISLDGDLNENPHILTTSVVKCCLMVDEGYRFAAPDIAASPAAHRCATDRLVKELRGFTSLEWVVVFGKPAWEALHELCFEGRPVIEALRAAGLRVVQFPHFAQNFQQRAVYACDETADAELLARKPDYLKHAPAARQMRTAVMAALAAL